MMRCFVLLGLDPSLANEHNNNNMPGLIQPDLMDAIFTISSQMTKQGMHQMLT